MIKENALAVYKNKFAVIKEITKDKITIKIHNGDEIKVREKDIEIIHPGPVDKNQKNFGPKESGTIREIWELLLAEKTAVSLKELAELVFNEYSPETAWAAWCLLTDGLYFKGTITAIGSRPADEVETEEKKRREKNQAEGERELFLERLRNRKPFLTKTESGGQDSTSSDDRRFIQDIEALAYGKTVKCRTMKDTGLGETPEEAHTLLLECGFWTNNINPCPARFNILLTQAQQIPNPPKMENRRDLTGLKAFAIDSPWSSDPDDAVSLETINGRQVLYVHVADPASSVKADSLCEREARDRGATLYIPEGSFRMLADEALPLFALGLAETSPALTFKMTLNTAGEIDATEIFPSVIIASRLSYREADAAMNGENSAETELLREICSLAERNLSRRTDAGAVNIDMPEIHIDVTDGQVIMEPIIRHRSADMVRECMLLAGEGAGTWAMQHNIPFPYIEQEMAELPGTILPGLAGAYQLRRCMRPRILSVKPGLHCGLGMDIYTQVTSPLRRYTDLLAHMQIRSFLENEKPLSADEVSGRMIAGEAAAAQITQAERASRSHWTMVYLSDKKDSVWDAVILEKKGNRWAAAIPALALETQVPLRDEPAPNDRIKLVLKSVNIPKAEAVFISQ